MEYYLVKNISDSNVSYRIVDLNNLHRTFTPGEVKRISAEELEKLTYVPGGSALIRDYLQTNKEVLDSLGIPNEPEDFMSEEQIIDLLKNGSLDQLLDALDFAKEGVRDLIKKYTVELPLNDVVKREAIKEKLHFDVTAVLARKKEEAAEAGNATTNTARPERRVKPATEEKNDGRRVTAPKYNIVSK